MSTTVSSSTLGVQNPLLQLGWARLTAAGAVLAMTLISAGLAWSGDQNGALKGLVIFRCCAAIAFAIHLGVTGLRAALAYVPQGDIPGSLKAGKTGGLELLEKRHIVGTYDPPQSLIGLLFYRVSPRLMLLTPPHRQAVQGVEIRFIWIALSFGGAFVMGWPALWLSVIAIADLAARGLAVSMVNATAPSTSGVRELREHLGDKGDPVGLFHHLRRVCDQFRYEEYLNRCLSDIPPHVAEHVQDSRVTAEYFIETQPRPVGDASPDGFILSTFAVGLTIFSWGLLLFTPLAADFGAGSVAAAISGFCGVAAATRAFRTAYGCYAAMRFESDLFLFRMRGTYNTTRVGSQLQRTSFQSDIYLDVHSARFVSELAPIEAGLLNWRADELLRSPRVIVTVTEHEVHAGRQAELSQSAHHYQDQGSTARPTNLASEDYAQYLLRLQTESLIAAQATTQGQLQALAQSHSGPLLPARPPGTHLAPAATQPSAPRTTSLLPPPPGSSQLPKQPLSGGSVPAPSTGPQKSVTPPPKSTPRKQVLPPPPPKKSP